MQDLFASAGVAVNDGANSITSGSVQFSNANGVTFGIAGQTLTASAGGGAGAAISAGTQSVGTGTVIFSNSNNLSFGMNGSKTVTASAWINLSGGTTSNNLSAFVMSNANNVSFGLDGSTMTASAASSLTNIKVSAGGTSNLLSAITFSDGSGVSFGLTASTLTASVAAGATATGNLGAIAINAATTYTSGTVVFSNSNGVTFGTNAQTVTASIAAVSAISGFAVNAATTYTSGTVVLSNANGVTFGTNAQTITASVAAVSAISGIAVNAATTYTSGTVVFSNSNGVTFGTNAQTITGSVAASATTVSAVASANTVGTNTRWAAEDHQHGGMISGGVSNVGNTAGNTTVRHGNFVFAGSNALTLSQETAAAGANTIHIQGALSATTISQVSNANSIGTRGSRFALEDHFHAGVPAIAAGSGTGNTAGNTATQFGTWVIAASNAATISGSSGAGGIHTVWVQGPLSATTISRVDSANTIGTRGSRFALEDHQHEGLYAVNVGGNTAGGNTSSGAGSFMLAGGPNITLSGATAAGGMTLSVSAAAPGTGAGVQAISAGTATAQNTVVLSNSNNISFGVNGSTVTANAQPLVSYWDNGIVATQGLGAGSQMNGTMILFPLTPLEPLFPGQMTASTMLLAISGLAGQTVGANTYTIQIGIYTISNSSTLNLLNSVASTWTFAVGNSKSISTFVGGFRYLTIHSTQWSASPTFSETRYIVGLNILSAGASIALSWLGQSINTSGQVSGTWGVSQAANTTQGFNPWSGQMTATTASPPGSIAISDFQHTGVSVNFVPRIVFNNLVSAY